MVTQEIILARKRRTVLKPSIILHIFVIFTLAPKICDAVGFSVLCPERGVLDCNDRTTNRSFFAREIPSNASVVMKDCTLRNCPPIVIRGGSATFKNVTFLNSSSPDRRLPGGAIHIADGAEVTLSHCNFAYCHSATSGGAVAVLESAVTVTHCTFYSCSAESGGSMSIVRSRATLASCRFENSYARSQGGAIYIDGNSSLELTGGSFEFCSAYFAGGALALAGGSAANVSSCWFNNSSVQVHGGAVYMSDASTLNCSSTAFANSNALNEGGTIYLERSHTRLTLLRCTVMNSSAVDMGGVLSVNSGHCVLESCIINNVSSAFGGSFLASRRALVEIRNVNLTISPVMRSHAIHASAGGCLYAKFNSHVAIYNSNFNNCTTSNDGGFALVASGSKLMVSASQILSDAPSGCGALAAVHDDNSQLTLRTVVFSNRKASAKSGGCVCIRSGSVVCEADSALLQCASLNNGGAIYLQNNGVLTLNGCRIKNSKAQLNGGGVAAIDHGRVILRGINQIDDNEAYLRGGAIFLAGEASLFVQDGTTAITGNIAKGCGGALALDGGAVTLEQSHGFLYTYKNGIAGSVGSLMCLTGSLPKIVLSPGFQNTLDGTIWVQDAATASQILKMKGSRLVANVTLSGPAVTLRISDGHPRVISINVSQPLPSFNVSAVDAFGNGVPQVLTAKLVSTANSTSGCNEPANVSNRYSEMSETNDGLATFPEVFIYAKPGNYCFEIQAAAATLPKHHEDFPWPLIQVQVLNCANEMEDFDEATSQCVTAPEVLLRRKNAFILQASLGAVAGSVALLLIVSALLLHRMRIARHRNETFAHANQLLDESDDHSGEASMMKLSDALRRRYNRKKYEIDKSRLQFRGKLGEGEFGFILRAILDDGSSDGLGVAVKFPLRFGVKSHYEALIEELKIMAYAGDHPNLVKLHRASTANLLKGELFIVMDLCECSLVEFLRNEAKIEGIMSPPTLSLSLRIGCGIAAGMEHLESKQIVHRDLAARNVLLDRNGSPKIADYGLARRMRRGYYRSKGNKSLVGLPWKWMALELLDFSTNDRFNSKGDIWSFGVVLWEIFTLGEDPYANDNYVKANNSSQLKEYLLKGGRLPQPQRCPKKIFAHIQRCWNKDPLQRPSFASCSVVMQEFLVKFEELEQEEILAE